MALKVKAVQSSGELRDFIRLSWKIYQRDKNWVPPLLFDRLEMLNQRRHPFYKDAAAELFFVAEDNELLAVAAVIENFCYNRVHNEKVAFFGFFEAYNRPDAVKLLFAAINEWAEERKLEILRGPVNLSSNYEIGLLVEGFDSPPVVMMNYNPPYYEDLLLKAGFNKVKDLFAYRITRATPMNPKLERVTEYLLKKTEFKLRTVRMNRLREEMKIIQQIYNNAWSRNWGFVPMSDEEVAKWAGYLKYIVRPELVLIGELNEEPVGFSMTIPNINELQIKNRRGHLLPFALNLLLRRNSIQSCRIMVLGIKQEYQQRGFDSFFYYQTWKTAAQFYQWGEASWILEDNLLMNRGAQMLGGELYKKYRIYEKKI